MKKQGALVLIVGAGPGGSASSMVSKNQAVERVRTAAISILSLLLLFLFAGQTSLFADVPPAVPVRGMVTMVDLGAKTCTPCKMMVPILEKLEKEYAGRAAIVFIDVHEDDTPAKRFGIQTIPTQIFFDKEGKEIYRHVGFLSEKEIVNRLKEIGVK